MTFGFVARIVGPLLLAIVLFAWGYSAGSASKQRAWDLATAAQVKAQLAAIEAARAAEQALQAKVKEANDARQAEKAKSERAAALLRAESDRLRSDIARFASAKPDDTAAACGERSATLGAVLDGVLSDYRACTESAESVAADLRAVMSAWPR